MYQLAARLGTKSYQNELFQTTLNEVDTPPATDRVHLGWGLTSRIESNRITLFQPSALLLQLLYSMVNGDHIHHYSFLIYFLDDTSTANSFISVFQSFSCFNGSSSHVGLWIIFEKICDFKLRIRHSPK